MTQEICRFCWDPNRDLNKVCQAPSFAGISGRVEMTLRGSKINVEPTEVRRIPDVDIDNCPTRKAILDKQK